MSHKLGKTFDIFKDHGGFMFALCEVIRYWHKTEPDAASFNAKPS